jgi:hypothetical protein
VYLDVTLRQLHISRNKKHRQYNVPEQEASMARLQHSAADGAVMADTQVGILPL